MMVVAVLINLLIVAMVMMEGTRMLGESTKGMSALIAENRTLNTKSLFKYFVHVSQNKNVSGTIVSVLLIQYREVNLFCLKHKLHNLLFFFRYRRRGAFAVAGVCHGCSGGPLRDGRYPVLRIPGGCIHPDHDPDLHERYIFRSSRPWQYQPGIHILYL